MLIPVRWINSAVVHPEPFARGRVVARTIATTRPVCSTWPGGLTRLWCILSPWREAGAVARTSATTRPVRSTWPGGLTRLWCILSPSSSGRKIAVCSARLPQHGAQLCHQDLKALWLAGPRLDVPAAEADEAHLGFAAPASEIGRAHV